MTLSGVTWRYVTLCDVMLGIGAFCRVMRLYVAICGLSGVLWRYVALCRVMWRFVALCGVI